MKKKNIRASFFGMVIFFVTVAVIITIAMLIYGVADEKSNGDKTTLSIVMLLVIAFLSMVCTLIDIIRRKIMTERPLKKILSATEKIAAGDFSVKLEPLHVYGKYDEYDVIMENLNVMTDELGKSEMLKADFISNVSHELKTPLAIIRNYAQLVKDESDEEVRKRHAQTLIDTSIRLNNLITNILKLNKLENQNLILEKEKIKLDENIVEAVLMFEELIDKKQIELDIDLEEVSMVSVPAYLEIIWNNLISNAIKFTDNRGKISVKLKNLANKAVVEISDTGCGISKETGEHIFDKFYQGDTSHSKEGNGLGLSLVKKVIDILGGEISVKSELGKGSTFTIVLYIDENE